MSPSDSPNVARLKAWAEARNLEVVASGGTQREPENVVAIRQAGSSPGGRYLLHQISMDSTNTAALYVIEALELLGVNLERR